MNIQSQRDLIVKNLEEEVGRNNLGMYIKFIVAISLSELAIHTIASMGYTHFLGFFVSKTNSTSLFVAVAFALVPPTILAIINNRTYNYDVEAGKKLIQKYCEFDMRENIADGGIDWTDSDAVIQSLTSLKGKSMKELSSAEQSIVVRAISLGIVNPDWIASKDELEYLSLSSNTNAFEDRMSNLKNPIKIPSRTLQKKTDVAIKKLNSALVFDN